MSINKDKKVEASEVIKKIRSESEKSILSENILNTGRFLTLLSDKSKELELNDSDKSNLTLAYYRIWYFRNYQINKYYSKNKNFKKFPRYLFGDHKETARQDIELLLNNNDNLLQSVLLPPIFKKTISETLSFIKKAKKKTGASKMSVYLCKNRNIWHTDKNKFCVKLPVKMYEIILYLSENRGYNHTEKIAEELGYGDLVYCRNRINAVKSKLFNSDFGISKDEFIQSKGDSGLGYRINPSFSVILDKK